MSKYRVISGPCFPVFRPEITPYLDTFHVVSLFDAIMCKSKKTLLFTKDTVIQLLHKEKWTVMKEIIGKAKISTTSHFPRKLKIDNQKKTGEDEIANQFNKYFVDLGPS